MSTEQKKAELLNLVKRALSDCVKPENLEFEIRFAMIEKSTGIPVREYTKFDDFEEYVRGAQEYWNK